MRTLFASVIVTSIAGQTHALSAFHLMQNPKISQDIWNAPMTNAHPFFKKAKTKNLNEIVYRGGDGTGQTL